MICVGYIHGFCLIPNLWNFLRSYLITYTRFADHNIYYKRNKIAFLKSQYFYIPNMQEKKLTYCGCFWFYVPNYIVLDAGICKPAVKHIHPESSQLIKITVHSDSINRSVYFTQRISSLDWFPFYLILLLMIIFSTNWIFSIVVEPLRTAATYQLTKQDTCGLCVM